MLSRSRSHSRARSDRGAITAEAAFVLPVLLALLAFGLWLVGVVVTNIRCIDAARDTARAAARGESIESARQLGQRSAPKGAAITINQTGSTIHVRVAAAPAAAPGVLRSLPQLDIHADATIHAEQPALPYAHTAN
ncbi:TadE family type IV pilus minor pilin [Kribbella sp. CA-293567]|uniref:TadE family type IV pilus minor pilin n=1 Tax=Kribbella sp. CA-293567 TaxID=3002436 RepID=UPI0022DE87E9|nr:TadE family type IV pilus minor pilin [Kribbella sp. CA-293567]WBQ04909.1 pilus assembly protein [Kribbella sp. CA-293567]